MYREKHAAKLKHGIDQVEFQAGATTSATVLTDLASRNLLLNNRTSEAGRSHTSYGSILGSCSNTVIPAPPTDCIGRQGTF